MHPLGLEWKQQPRRAGEAKEKDGKMDGSWEFSGASGDRKQQQEDGEDRIVAHSLITGLEGNMHTHTRIHIYIYIFIYI